MNKERILSPEIDLSHYKKVVVMGVPGSGKSTFMGQEKGNKIFYDDVFDDYLSILKNKGVSGDSMPNIEPQYHPLFDELMRDRVIREGISKTFIEVPAVGDYPLGQDLVKFLSQDDDAFFVMFVPSREFLKRSMDYRENNKEECALMAKKVDILRIVQEYQSQADEWVGDDQDLFDKAIRQVLTRVEDKEISLSDINRLSIDVAFAYEHLRLLGVKDSHCMVIINIED